MSLTMDATQQAILANPRKKITWLFEVSPAVPVDSSSVFYWSTKDVSYDGQNYSFKIDRDSFSGINLNRPKSEHNMIAPSDVSFRAKFDYDHADDFRGGSVLIKVVMGAYLTGVYTETIIRQFRMDIDSCAASGGYLNFKCIDFVQKYLKGNYPLTPLSRTVFPSSRGESKDDPICIPKIFGTAYIPLKCIYYEADSSEDPTPSGRYYLIGPADKTYTITKVRTPRDWPAVVEWDAGDTTFNQYIVDDVNGNSWKVLEPLIADMDLDGTLDSVGVFPQGEKLLDLLVEIYQDDTLTDTNPADIIYQFLLDIGIPAEYIDYGVGSSFETSAGVFDTWGLSWEGAFFFHQTRTKVLAQLLNMCHATLVLTDKIELHILDKTSQSTFTQTDVLMRNKISSFEITTSLNQEPNDSGVIGYAPTGYPQDMLVQCTVAAKSTLINPGRSVLELPFVRDDENAQRLGALCFQRAFLAGSDLNFDSKMSKAHLVPDDVITIDSTRYGGTYPVLIDGVRFSLSSIHFTATKYIDILDDWEDLAPVSLDLVSDTSEGTWRYVIAGPDSPTGMVVNALPGRLRVGDSILFDPDKFSGAGAIQVGRDLGRDVPFNIYDKLYWDHILDALFARNLWISGELHASVMAIDEVHANAGTLLLSASGVLSQDVTTPSNIEDRFIISINEQTTGDYSFMAVGDFLQMKISSPTGINEAWMQVEGHLWDLLDDDCTTLTGWDLAGTNGGSVTAVTFQGRSCFELDSGTSGFYSASALKALAPFGSTLVIDFDVYFDNIGVQASEPFNLDVYSSAADQELIVSFASDGIFVFRTSQYIQVATGIVQMDTWQHYTVEVDWIGKTVDISLDGNLVVHGADFDYSYPTVTDRMRFLQKGSASTRSISYIDRARASTVLMEAENEFPVTLKYGSTDTVFSEGTAVVNWGSSTDRKMLLTSDMAYSPYLDIFTTGSTPWKGVTSTTRLGNLAGIIDADFGGALSGEGLYSDNVYLKGMVQITGGSGATNLDDLSTAVADAIPDDVLQSGDSIANLEWDQTYLTGQLVASPIISGNLGFFSGVFTVGENGIVIDGPNKMIYASSLGWWIADDGDYRFGGDQDNYIEWDGSTFGISTDGVVDIKSGGDLMVRTGGDIILEGGATNPAKIIWDGTLYDVELYSNSTGDYFFLRPATADVVTFALGSSSYRFDDIVAVARTMASMSAYSSSSRYSILEAYHGSTEIEAQIRAYWSSTYYSYVDCVANASDQYIAMRGRIVGGGGFNGCRIKSGSYTGTGSSNYQDITGIGFTPLAVFVIYATAWSHASAAYLAAKFSGMGGYAWSVYNVAVHSNTIPYMGSALNGYFTVSSIYNESSTVYRYIAIG